MRSTPIILKDMDSLGNYELHEYYIDDSGEKCFYFSDIHDLFNLIFKDDKENRVRWNSYAD